MEGRRRGVLFLLVSFLLTQVLSQQTPAEPRVSCPIGHDNAWQYTRTGEWGGLCRHYSTCSTGRNQSPINIPTLTPQGRTPVKLQLDLNLATVNLIRIGNNYLTMPTPDNTGTLTWKGRLFNLTRIEFHSPSEHTIAGKQSAFEVQLYFSWRDVRGTTQAAVAFLYNVGDCEDQFLASILPAVPRRYRCECGNNRTESFAPFNEECDLGAAFNSRAPNTCRPDCRFPRCGDSVVDRGEECDEGNVTTRVPGKCRPGCIKPYCPDGIVDPGEVCDKGSWWEGSGCTATCKLECGDACLQPGEECDYGIPHEFMSNASITNAGQRLCRSNCLWSRCGDGILDAGEQCDEGNWNNVNITGSFRPNGCRPNCTLPVCGDGVVDTNRSNVNATGTPNGGEQCEPSLSPLCGANCAWLCGNGQLDANETCDNGTGNSLAPNAVCRPWNSITPCRPPSCGDGIVDAGEDCDSAGIETVLCFRNCTFRCGNRQIDANETCDNGHPLKFPARVNDGNSDTRPNACRMNCQLYFCGDGVVDNLGCEQCDNGTRNNDTQPNACRTNCKKAYCGDGVVDDGEECDDKNNVDDDGCSCCRLDCGNGVKQGTESCDDGAANSKTLPDRCRPNCQRHTCGDGVTDSDEECDFASGKVLGCTAKCTFPFCGDGVLQAGLGEECDAGSDNSYTTINGCSPLCTLNRCGQTLTNTQVNLQLLASNAKPVVGAYHYQGSETRPPCTENVNWFVVPTARTLTLQQLRLFTSVIFKNNRPTQRLFGRNPLIAPATGAGLPPIDPRAVGNCGNGRVEIGEQCDNGAWNSNTLPDACRTDCTINRCGDGVVDAGEECDTTAPHCKGCKLVRLQYNPRPLSDGQCSGNLQSPIRLPQPCPQARPLNLNHPSNIQYNPTPLTLFHTGQDILFPVQAQGTFNWKGVSYALKHIEFHEPSEHYIGSQRFAFEVQLYHESQTPGVQRSAVLSVLFNEGAAANAFLQPILDRLPLDSEARCGNGIKDDMLALPNGAVAREECDDGARNNDRLPNACRTNCMNAHCGDGVIDTKEVCDMGLWNSMAPNMCRPSCQLPYCGDGVTDDAFGEQCDDGNNQPGDGCDNFCMRECGNGQLDQNEVCDNGPLNSNNVPDACRATCQLPRCGDGTVDSGEECDSGRLNSDSVADACRSTCKKPVCGDGVTDPAYGEQCDGGAGCTPACTKLCGNGVLDAGEQCDNGTMNSNTLSNACRLDCMLPKCGDGVVDTLLGEQCDEKTPTPRCQGCKVLCGNGIIEAPEECDNGAVNSDVVPNACRTTCKLAGCGDGVWDAWEECDNGTGNANAADKCRTSCQVPKCGDGIVDSGEQCDDGNNLDGDGCSSSCRSDCGNGRIEPGEQCDDGADNSNTRPGACRTNCKLPVCGDSTTDAGEECDNGAQNVFGPNSCRPDCTLPKCGDGIIDHLYGEICDQASRNSWTTIDGCSPICTPNLPRQSIWFNLTVDPAAVIPKQPGTFWYQGSRTSAPCAENVDYFVFTTPQSITTCQLNQFRRSLNGNARCLQARNGRPVTFLEVTAKCGDGIVEGNEECDNGPRNSDHAPNACRRNCKLASCGDGVKDAGEVCDGTPNCGRDCKLSCPTGSNGTCGAAAAAAAAAAANDAPQGTVIKVDFARILAK